MAKGAHACMHVCMNVENSYSINMTHRPNKPINFIYTCMHTYS